MISSALSVAPLRVSFVGGGTDIESFYRHEEGAVVSCAINKFVFVHVKIHDDSFGERYRVSYSQIEHAQEIREIKNDIVRTCLEFLEINRPVQISTLSDLPAGTGLGSSSSFAVALLLALHEIKGTRPTKHQLAEEACHIEIELLGHPIGKQDQYAAAFGGMNFFRFRTDGRVSVEPICISANERSQFLDRCRLFWTSKERSANAILSDQALRSSLNFYNLQSLALLAHEFRHLLEKSEIDWKQLANLILKSWNLKQELSPMIQSEDIKAMMDNIRANDDIGVKLLGAGGGGFILSFNGGAELEHSPKPFLSVQPTFFLPRIDDGGARIISTF